MYVGVVAVDDRARGADRSPRGAPRVGDHSTGALSTRAARERRRDRKDTMDGSRFDTLVRLISEDASRRGLLRSTLAATFAGLGAASLFGRDDAEAKSCKAKCKKKNSKKAKRKCKKKCKKQDQNDKGQKPSGALCDNTSECAEPNNICAQPLNAGDSDKKCCGATGAVCGGDNIDFDDIRPFCCQGFKCSTDGQGTSTPGTCQPVNNSI